MLRDDSNDTARDGKKTHFECDSDQSDLGLNDIDEDLWLETNEPTAPKPRWRYDESESIAEFEGVASTLDELKGAGVDFHQLSASTALQDQDEIGGLQFDESAELCDLEAALDESFGFDLEVDSQSIQSPRSLVPESATLNLSPNIVSEPNVPMREIVEVPSFKVTPAAALPPTDWSQLPKRTLPMPTIARSSTSSLPQPSNPRLDSNPLEAPTPAEAVPPSEAQENSSAEPTPGMLCPPVEMAVVQPNELHQNGCFNPRPSPLPDYRDQGADASEKPILSAKSEVESRPNMWSRSLASLERSTVRDWTRLVLAVTAIVGLTVIIVTYLQTSQGRRISRFDDGDDSLLHDVDRRRQRDQLLESIESSAFAIEVDDGSVQRSLGAGSRAVSPNVVVGTAAMAQRIAVALESRTRRISACFEQNPSSDLITSDVILEVTVDTDGVAHEVRVLPSALEETRLGRCLISVTHSTSFPHQDLPIRVRVPLVVSGVR